ncbi:two-component system response regulator [Oleiphilus messinensis]|nr:EAL domain-containing protein [Oleiphilus messinensis]
MALTRPLTPTDPPKALGSPPDTLKVLIIDDSMDDVELILRAMKKGGFSVEHGWADSAASLSQTLPTNTWDLVITDHNMMGFSSSDALKIVKEFDEGIPVIIVSGAIGEEVAAEAMRLGVHDYIMKDNLTRLIPAIRRELKQNENRQARLRAEAHIDYLFSYDSLTGLTNRQEFEKRLHVLVRASKNPPRQHVLMFLDLDQFKIINDTCGHIAGDELLVQTTHLLKRHIRNQDTLARLGGDEFGIILEDCPQEHALKLAERIRSEVKEHRFVWGDKPFAVSVSIGMVKIDQHTKNHHELLSCADLACYAAKDKGRNGITWYSEDDAELHQRRDEMQWASRIKQAVEENRFTLYFQPMRPLSSAYSHSPHGEFLLRLKQDGRLVAPGAFIPAAERYNLMPLIDGWVVNNAFRYLAESGLGNAREGVYFINLSGTTLSDKHFFEQIQDWLKFYHIIPQRVCFEITETAAIANLINAVDFIAETREKGFKFALDDFGVGLSSFSYLKTIPVDYLKIDGSFVKNLLADPIDEGIVEACNRIGHAAGLKTIAEFVEDDPTTHALARIGVDFAQGYGIATPAPLQEYRRKR